MDQAHVWLLVGGLVGFGLVVAAVVASFTYPGKVITNDANTTVLVSLTIWALVASLGLISMAVS